MPDGADLADVVRRRAKARLDEIRRNKERYDADFPVFASDCLKIRPKAGADMLLRLNRVQRRVHESAEDQLRRTGKVRKLVVKARQPGISTYIEARYYWKVSRRKGVRAFILTHSDEATGNLFEMAERFHENNPNAPRTGASNAKELSFSEIDSSYRVGTAGSKAVGRSETIQYLHGSEVAFWPNAQEHAKGILQTVPNMEGTEVWLESTANGIGGLFYNMVMAAQRGESEYEIIFVPWFEHDEYVLPAPDNWKAPSAFVEYALIYKLTPGQVYWAYLKNAELAAADALPASEICWHFKQEYPASVEEAFRASREGSFIRSELVAAARAAEIEDLSNAPLVFGCDFACGGDGEGGDANYFISRRGRVAGKEVNLRFHEKDTVQVANKLADLIDFHDPDMVFLDKGGGGAAVYDILRNRGYGAVLTLINFGGKPHDGRKYRNKRAEMGGELRDWLADEAGADIPDDDALEGDITATKAKEDNNGAVIFEKKDEIRKRLGFSPDGFDALGLTFAENVVADLPKKASWRDDLDQFAAGGPASDNWMTR